MNNQISNEKKMRLFIVLLFAILFISIYFSIIISAFIDGFPTIHINEALITILDHGYSLSSFVISFLILFIVTVCLVFMDKSNDVQEHPIDKNRVASKNNNYGRAEFEKPNQYRSLAQIRPIEDCVGHIYGMLDSKGRKCIDFFPDPKDPSAHINNHIFALGASGSGKTYTTGLTYCLQSIKMEHSLIATDPKGELFAILAEVLRSNGYVVRRLNFNIPEKSDGWDCMKAFTLCRSLSETQLMVDRFSAAIISQIAEKSKDIFQGTGPLLLLRAVILRLVLDPTIPSSEKTIYTIYNWLQMELKALNSDKFNKDSMPAEAWPCLGPWQSFYSSSENVTSNIRLNLVSGLNILNTDIISKILSTDDIDISLPGEEKCAYFVQFPVPNEAYSFPICLFFTMLFASLQNQAIERKSRKLKREVDFFLDEFAQIGVLPAWEQRMSTVRSYGLNIFMIVQTMSQFTKFYKTDSNTIISNCATWLVLGANDYDTAEDFCKRIGQTTIEVQTISEEQTGMIKKSSKISTGTGKTYLLSPDEIMKLPPNTLIIILQRHNPIYANSVPHTLHPLAKMIKEVGENDEHYFTDADNLYDENFIKPTRTERQKIEKNRIELYRENHRPFIKPDNIYDAPIYDFNFLEFVKNRIFKMRRILLDTLKTITFTSFRKKSNTEPSGAQKSQNRSDCPPEIPLFDVPDVNSKISRNEEPFSPPLSSSTHKQDRGAVNKLSTLSK